MNKKEWVFAIAGVLLIIGLFAVGFVFLEYGHDHQWVLSYTHEYVYRGHISLPIAFKCFKFINGNMLRLQIVPYPLYPGGLTNCKPAWDLVWGS